jgi:hypothetical protein
LDLLGKNRPPVIEQKADEIAVCVRTFDLVIEAGNLTERLPEALDGGSDSPFVRTRNKVHPSCPPP